MNWVKSLPEYGKTLNEEPREKLSRKYAFEVLYGRKFNHADQLSEFPVAQEWDQTGEEYETMIAPKPSGYTQRTKACKRMQQSVASASKKCEDNDKKGLRNNPPSVYNVGENVLIRYPPAKKISRKRCVLHAKVLKRNLQTCKYLVKFNYPAGTSKILQKWIPINDITSRTLDEEKKKRKVACNRNKRKHREKYFIPMENDRELFSSQLLNQGLAVWFDPPKDGNC